MKQKNRAILHAPQAFICINKGRTKVKEDKFVYLDNGTEFTIELFNPTTETVLAKISINNKLISYSGIILRPGERVFLERYIDNPNKFKFETYSVNGNTEEIQKAIEQNGLIKVEFYNEDTTPTYTCPPYVMPTTYPNPWIGGTGGNPNQYFFGTSSNNTTVGTCCTTTLDLNGATLSYTASADMEHSFATAPLKKKQMRSLETGRIEQGSYSNQSFQKVSKKFYSYTTNVTEYHIKPTSQMYVDSKDIKGMNKYCSECGAKIKNNFKYCPNCSNKL